MASRISLALSAVCLFTLLSSGCASTQTSNQTEKPDTVSVAEAQQLIAAWNKEHDSREQKELKEVTTKDIRERLYAQVFKFSDPTASARFDAYLIKDREVYPMSTGFGGYGLMEMCVCDIDNDSKDDLVYVYSFGSGIHRSVVEAYRFSASCPTKIPAACAVMYADVSLKKKGEHKIDLFATDTPEASNDKVHLGELALVKSKERELLDIKRDASLPENWKKNIWKCDTPAK